MATQRATVTQDEGVVQSDQGQIDAVKLNINYCRITAPLTGPAVEAPVARSV